MTDLALDLSHHVLPNVPMRQWVCSLPFGVRYVLGYDARLCSAALGAFTKEVSASLRRRAKRALGLGSVAQAHTGMVTFVQRFDSGLRLNPHFHTLALDGVYVRETSGELSFRALPPPSVQEVEQVARRTAERLAELLRRHGRALDPELADLDDDELAQEQPALAACYGAAVGGRDLLGPRAGRPTLRVVQPETAQHRQLVGVVGGVNVHAGVALHGADKKRLELLCRYLARPPIAQERLELLDDGRVRYQMKKPWSDGTVALVFEPLDLIARICAIIPPPRFNLVRYHGVLAPGSGLRDQVVPGRDTPRAASVAPSEDPDDLVLGPRHLPGQLELPGTQAAPPRRRPWAWLLRHVFEADVTLCPRCGGRLRWLETATSTEAITQLLAAHGLGPAPPPPATRYQPAQLELDFGAV